MSKKNQSKNIVPTVRALGFSDDWEQHKLNDITQRVRVGFVGTLERYYTNNKGIPLYRTGNLSGNKLNNKDLKYVTRDFHSRNSKSSLHYGDILIARHGDSGKAVQYLSRAEANSLNIVIITPNSEIAVSRFLTDAINSPLISNRIKKLAAGSTQSVINTTALEKLNIFYPSNLDEQKSLSKLMISLDNTIALHQQKFEALKKVSRWAKHNLLPMPKKSNPQVHIKNNNENWTTGKLGNILKPNNEKNRSQKFNLVESVSNKNGLVKQTNQFKDYEVASKDTHNYYVIRPTTFVYNPSRINVGSIGYKKAGDSVSIVSPLYVSFQTSSDIDDGFLWIWFHSAQFNNERRILSTGSVRTTLSYEQLCLANITYPDIEEQREIAQFFVSLETRIDLEFSVINYLKRVKRWALDNMFV